MAWLAASARAAWIRAASCEACFSRAAAVRAVAERAAASRRAAEIRDASEASLPESVGAELEIDGEGSVAIAPGRYLDRTSAWLSCPRERGAADGFDRTRARSTSELSPRIRWFRDRLFPAPGEVLVGAALGEGNGRRAGTTASPNSTTVGALRPGAEVVVRLPAMLERPGVDHPVVGEPIGWGRLELGRLVGVRDGCEGAGRPLITEPGLEERVGVAVGRVGVYDGREAVGVELGRLLTRVGVERTLRVGVERLEEDGRAVLRELWGAALRDVVRCAEERWAVERWAADLELVVLDVDVR